MLSFFFNAPATTEIYTLSLHDALPILFLIREGLNFRSLISLPDSESARIQPWIHSCGSDRKSTRLNSSHTVISYAVFCLKKKTKITVIVNAGLRQPIPATGWPTPVQTH